MWHRGDGGYVTPAFVAATGLTLVLLVAVANLLVAHYARGVLQAAVEEGARQAVAAGSDACLERVSGVVADHLGALAAGVDLPTCTVHAAGADVSLSATVDGWLPGLPATSIAVQATASLRPATVP